jgi:hypothetical protein
MKRSCCLLHAYMPMTDHFHLVLTPDFSTGPALLAKILGQRYVQYVNRAWNTRSDRALFLASFPSPPASH